MKKRIFSGVLCVLLVIFLAVPVSAGNASSGVSSTVTGPSHHPIIPSTSGCLGLPIMIICLPALLSFSTPSSKDQVLIVWGQPGIMGKQHLRQPRAQDNGHPPPRSWVRAPCFQMQAAQAGTPAYSEDGQASEKKNNQRVKGLENREFPAAISLPCV